ncbi:MAG: AIPR family protein [Bacteroidales bacterium]|nr:AIPR family protein [Bacteroidales bacterium]
MTYGRKLGVCPYVVVRGSQKNYVQFMQYNLVKEPDSIYFEDVVAKMILFRSAEKIYGVKPNSIGDLRYITVPYSISYLGYKTDYKLDLYKIWRNQSVSENLSNFLYDLMVKVESFIKTNAPGALFGEWAKKEECWNMLKESDLDVDFSVLKSEFADAKTLNQRAKITDEETLAQQVNEELELIKSVPAVIWGNIENWGRESEKLTTQQIDTAYKLKGRVRNNSKISDYERQKGIEIIDIVTDFAPEILHEIDNIQEEIKPKENNDFITIELINQIVAWDKKNRALRDFEFKFMFDLSTGKKELNERNKNIAVLNFEKVKRRGFTF